MRKGWPGLDSEALLDTHAHMHTLTDRDRERWGRCERHKDRNEEISSDTELRQKWRDRHMRYSQGQEDNSGENSQEIKKKKKKPKKAEKSVDLSKDTETQTHRRKFSILRCRPGWTDSSHTKAT